MDKKTKNRVRGGLEPATRWVPNIADNTPGTSVTIQDAAAAKNGGSTYLPLDHKD